MKSIKLTFKVGREDTKKIFLTIKRGKAKLKVAKTSSSLSCKIQCDTDLGPKKTNHTRFFMKYNIGIIIV